MTKTHLIMHADAVELYKQWSAQEMAHVIPVNLNGDTVSPFTGAGSPAWYSVATKGALANIGLRQGQRRHNGKSIQAAKDRVLGVLGWLRGKAGAENPRAESVYIARGEI